MTEERKQVCKKLHDLMQQFFKRNEEADLYRPNILAMQEQHEAIKTSYQKETTPQEVFEYELEQLSNEGLNARESDFIARARVSNIFGINF